MNTSAHLFSTESAVPASLLNALETGLAYLNPVYAEGNPEKLLTLAFEQLNPVAQRLLGLPEFAVGTVATLLPQATGFADFCHATLSGGGGRPLRPTPHRPARAQLAGGGPAPG